MAVHLLSERKFKLGFATWWILWSGLFLYVLNRYSIPLDAAATDTLVTNAMIAGACLLIANNMRYYLPRQDRFWYVLIISITLSGMCTAFSNLALIVFFKDTPGYENYVSLLPKSWLIRFGIALLLIGCMSIISLLWYVLQEQHDMESKKQEAEKMLKDAELYNLRRQLQPHFLFNSLNSISALTITDAEGARAMIQQLSDFLRGTLRREETQLITLDEELLHLKLYLDIEKVRFGHRLQTMISCEEGTPGLKLPALLLQPVVENAIKFGLYNTLDDITIKISAVKEGDALVVAVANPFDEDCLQAATGTGFGLESIRRRLYLLFGRYSLLETTAAGNNFITKLTIPQTHSSSAK